MEEVDLSTTSHTIQMLKDLLVVFNFFSLQFIPRSSNTLAHSLATLDLNSSGIQEWFPPLPEGLFSPASMAER